ncbi:MAG TPA: glucan 1,4-alpha-glucosidase [Candidatus Eremiobacteraceae bacterium]|nr:glucan 1,4-alpha-glucosidase [Candidatus Eremiobacteraceae bacterium]
MSDSSPRFAPGWPGIPPRWTSSAKTGAGTALNRHSMVWFTLSHGILNEVYYPRVDQACTRDLGFIVTDGRSFFSEEKRHCTFENKPFEPGVPAFELTNTEIDGRYGIYKEIFTDPYRNVVVQLIRFRPLKGQLSDYRLYALLSPHLANCGYGNTGWVGDYKGVPMLMAERDGTALAMGCSAGWKKMSVGFVGVSDGWRDLSAHFQMDWEYPRAENGNIACTGEIDLAACNGEFVLALGFGSMWTEAGQQVRSSLFEEYDYLRRNYVRHWRNWQDTLLKLDEPRRPVDLYRASTAAMRTHESKDFVGGVIASLSIPWGFSKGDEDLGGYHLIWPRDLVETAGALLAAGAVDDAVRVLRYLQATQEAAGNWAQNLWLDGRPYWNGIQMDETAFPILLLDLLRREATPGLGKLEQWWPMVRSAASFIVRNGPVTQQDRWEEDGGYSPFTLAAEISALLAAAEIAELTGHRDASSTLRDTADAWNDNIERWVYAMGGDLAEQIGVEGYYVRIAPPETDGAASPTQGFVPIKNRPPGDDVRRASHLISPDSLALVRFGLRAPNDPRILNTIRVIDALLKVQLPQGPCWYRYNGDGYGEHNDGSPFDGTGIGRPWPLLAGERAHYELAAGRPKEAEALLAMMEACPAGAGRMLPEQVWDVDDIPALELFRGKPSGSACPLVWAHAEYVKLRRSLRDGKIFDQPPQTVQRYLIEKPTRQIFGWRFNNKTRSVPRNKTLRLVLLTPALVHWSIDGWKSSQDTNTRDTGLGTYILDLPTASLPAGSSVVFTFYWPKENRWEGTDYSVVVQ